MKDKQDMEGLWKSSRRYIFIVAFGVILYEIIENLTAVKSSVGGFFDAISPIFIAMAISFIANMPMCFLEKSLSRPCPSDQGSPDTGRPSWSAAW